MLNNLEDLRGALNGQELMFEVVTVLARTEQTKCSGLSEQPNVIQLATKPYNENLQRQTDRWGNKRLRSFCQTGL